MLASSETASPSSRDASLLAIHSLDHLSLSVPDLAEAQAFYQAFGLRPSGGGKRLDISTQRGLAIELFESERRHLHHLTLGIYAGDRARFEAKLQREGIARIDAPAGIDRDSLWIRDPDGNAIELAVLPRASLDEKFIWHPEIAPGGAAGAPPFERRPHPRRLGHVFLFTPDVDRAIAFYGNVLGMRLSDRSGSIVAFMHSPHGSDHHVIAFGHSSRPGFHHASFEVADIDDIGLGATHMAEDGHKAGWGFGRHALGSNYFHYIRDPWGSFAEYFCDIDYIPAGSVWPARDVDPRFSLHLWGPDVPPYFLMNFEGLTASDVALR